MNALLLGFAFGLMTQSEPARVQSLTGNIEKIEAFESKILGNKRTVQVYLPPQYKSEPTRRFKVVVMHDGQNCFDGATSYIPNQEWRADEAAEGLIGAGLLEPIIIVAVDNMGAERGDEFLPIRVSFRGNRAGGKADLYTQMICDELIPMIDKKYRTRTSPADRLVVGSSFGGVISLHIVLNRPEVFGNIGVVSPSLWVGEGRQIRDVEALPKKLPLKIWTDMGTGEGAELVTALGRLGKAFESKGWERGKNLAVYVDHGAKHNEAAWAIRFPALLMYFFGR